MSQYEKSSKYLNYSHKIKSNKRTKKLRIATSYINIGNIFNSIGQYDKAL